MEGYLLLSLMAIVCGVFLWRPLLSNGKPTASRGEHEIEFYKDQLGEIERDLNRGIIRADEAEASRIEISRKIINITKSILTSQPLYVCFSKYFIRISYVKIHY
mgnify:CR=1 FL=1